MVGAKDFQVAELIPQAQLVVSLKLVPMAGPADALKVLTPIRIASLQSLDKPCRYDVVWGSETSKERMSGTYDHHELQVIDITSRRKRDRLVALNSRALPIPVDLVSNSSEDRVCRRGRIA